MAIQAPRYAAPASVEKILDNQQIDAKELRSDLVYGDTGSGKTQQMAWAAYDMAKVCAKKTLLVTADGGSISAYQPLINLGLINVFPMLSFPCPIESMQQIVRGSWPIRVDRNGVPTLTFVPAAAKRLKNDPNWFNEYGLIIFESLGSICSAIKRNLQERTDITIPQTPDRDVYFVTGGEEGGNIKYTFSAPSHIGFVMERMEQWIHEASQLPYERVLWTARVAKSGEEGTDKAGNLLGTAIYGPELIGKAKTHLVPGWFGGCYHLDSAPVGAAIADNRDDYSSQGKSNVIRRQEHRLYFMSHPDSSTGVMYHCKPRIPAARADLLGTLPYVTCTPDKDGMGGEGIRTMWAAERKGQEQVEAALRVDLADVLQKFKKGE